MKSSADGDSDYEDYEESDYEDDNMSLDNIVGANIPDGEASSLTDFVTEHTERSLVMMKKEEIDAWRASNKKSSIVIIAIRITPKTLDHNDGLGQVIVCLIGVFLLNLWGKDSGQSYEVFPKFISLDGSRQDPENNYGLDDLFTTIHKHGALAGHDVIVLTRTGLRYTEKPDDIEFIQNFIGDLLDDRSQEDSSKAISSCELMAMDSMFIEDGVKKFRKLEYDCKKNIDAAECGTNQDVAIDYDDEVTPEDKKNQEKTNALAKKYRDGLDSEDNTGEMIRELVKSGYKGVTNIPSYGLHTRLNNVIDELDKGGDELRHIVSDMIKSVQESGGKLPLHWVNAEAICCTRRSPGGNSTGIGESEGVRDMGGAQSLPCRQVTANLAGLKVVNNITSDILFIHAEAVSRDSIQFQEWHARLLVLLIKSGVKPVVVVSTLVRLGANELIVTTILEFIQQLQATLITADCIGYSATKQASNETKRKLKTHIERSLLVEKKEDVIGELSKELQVKHYALAAAGRINVMMYGVARSLRAQVSGEVLQALDSRTVGAKRARME